MIAALIVALGCSFGGASWSFLKKKKKETGGSLQDLLFDNNASTSSEEIQRGISFSFLPPTFNCLAFRKLLINLLRPFLFSFLFHLYMSV